MGKKSKKGVSRAGNKRPKAGAGKAKSGSHPRTKSFDSSQGDVVSVESNGLSPANAVGKNITPTAPPSDLNLVMQKNADNKENGDSTPTTTTNDAPLSVEGAEPKTIEIPPAIDETEPTIPDDVVDASIVKAAEDALRKPEASADVVEKKAPEPVGKEKTPDPIIVEKAEKVVEKPRAVPNTVLETKEVAETATKSRGLALDEPAPDEAAAKQKDCSCVIL